jgi:hypothetical protein
MDIFENIAHNNPDRAINLLGRHTRFIPESPQELADGLRGTMRNLRWSEKEEFLRELREAHPDYDLFMDAIEPNYQKDFEEKAQASGCGCGAVGSNGQSTVQAYMATGEAQAIMSEYQQKLMKMEQETVTNKAMNDKIFKVVIVAVVVAIAYKMFK